MGVGKTVLTGGGLGLGALAGTLIADGILGVDMDTLQELSSGVKEALTDAGITSAQQGHLETAIADLAAEHPDFVSQSIEGADAVPDLTTDMKSLLDANEIAAYESFQDKFASTEALRDVFDNSTAKWVGGATGAVVGGYTGNRIAASSERAAERQQAANFQAQILAERGMTPAQYATLQQAGEQPGMLEQTQARDTARAAQAAEGPSHA